MPADLADAWVAAALNTGGRLLDRSDRRWRIADPEDNELVIVTAP